MQHIISVLNLSLSARVTTLLTRHRETGHWKQKLWFIAKDLITHVGGLDIQHWETDSNFSWSGILKSSLLGVKAEDSSKKFRLKWLLTLILQRVSMLEEISLCSNNHPASVMSIRGYVGNGDMLMPHNRHTRNWCFQKLRLRILTCVWYRQNDQPNMCAFAISPRYLPYLWGVKSFSVMKKKYIHVNEILAK